MPTSPTTLPPPPSSPTAPGGDFTNPNTTPGGAGNLSTSLSGAFGIPTADLSIVVPGFNGQTLQQMIQEFQTAPAATRGPIIEQLRAAGYFAGITSGSELDQETTAYARLLRDSIWSGRDPNSTLTDAQQVQQANAGAAAQPRYLGLGKYPIKLTSPEDVAMTADSIFQNLLGRRATPGEKAAVTQALHGLEQTAGATELQQYASQQEAYFEQFHGGAVNAPGTVAPGAAPSASAAAPAISTSAPGGGLTGGPVSGGVAPAASQGATTLPATTPPSQVPPGAIKLADGTYIVPPQSIVYPGAPSAAGAAYGYAMANDQPEVQGRTVAAAMQAIAQFVGQK